MEPPRKTDLVIYHGQCNDGFAAAWIFRVFQIHCRTDEGVEYRGVQHGEVVRLDVFRDKRVVFLDFCFARSRMEEIADVCRSLIVLDHHQTAMEAMQDMKRAHVLCYFDMSRSGAGLALDACDWAHELWTPGRPSSRDVRETYWPVNFVEDRDLWRHRLPHSREINAFLSTLPFNFEDWDLILNQHWTVYIEKGNAVLAKTRQYVAEVANNALSVVFEGMTMPCVNAPQINISELLNFLCRESGVALGWWQMKDGRFKYSLRSSPGTVDVSRLAQRYGGGGHPNAAGFETDKPIHF